MSGEFAMSGGATQWRHPCRCLERRRSRGSSKEHVMHSEVSEYNLEYFIDEDRVGPAVSEADLRRILERAPGPVIVCNVCRTIKVVARGDTEESDPERSTQEGLV